MPYSKKEKSNMKRDKKRLLPDSNDILEGEEDDED